MNMLGNKSTATYFPFFWHYKQSSSGRAHSLTFTYDFFVTRIFEDEGGRRRVCVWASVSTHSILLLGYYELLNGQIFFLEIKVTR